LEWCSLARDRAFRPEKRHLLKSPPWSYGRGGAVRQDPPKILNDFKGVHVGVFRSDDGIRLASISSVRERYRVGWRWMKALIDDPGLYGLYESWRRKRGAKAFPSSLDLELPSLRFRVWPSIGLIDVVRTTDTTEFRYGRIGVGPFSTVACDHTGEFLDNALLDRDGYRDYVVGIYRQAAATRMPIYAVNLVTLEGQAPMLTKRVCLPLSSDGMDVDMALVARVFVYEPDWFSYIRPLADGFAETERLVLHS
jgi:hypothetical protein